MQNKHIVIVHKNEDRDIFINKIKYPKTIYHVGDNPEKDDIVKDYKILVEKLFMSWIVDNYNNLPDYVIFMQAIPDDHIHEPLLAIDSTLKSDFGSFAYARSLHDQYTSTWDFCNPVRDVLKALGINYFNDTNSMKQIYICYPGSMFFVSRKKILEKPISFYENFISFDQNLYNKFLTDFKKPKGFWKNWNKANPKYKNKLIEQKNKQISDRKDRYTNHKYENWEIGLCFETLWFNIWADKEFAKILDKSQAILGNELYFDTEKNNYNINFKFEKFPYSSNPSQTITNFKLLENDWFDYECPYYLKWREKLIEKTIWEGKQRGFDGQALLKYYEQIGYKHISL